VNALQDHPFALLLPFDRDNADFARGVEVGMAWARLASGCLPLTVTAHAQNAEMMLRLAEANDVHVTAEDIGGDWLQVTFG
jgi:hypothetical protein